MQAELTSIWEPTGVQEENVPCEEKKKKEETHSVDGREIRGRCIRSLKHGIMRRKERTMQKIQK